MNGHHNINNKRQTYPKPESDVTRYDKNLRTFHNQSKMAVEIIDQSNSTVKMSDFENN